MMQLVTFDPRNPQWDDPALAASIRSVLRKNGAPLSEVDDLAQEVLLEVLRSTQVPPAEPDRTRYIHGIARNIARKGSMRRAAAPAMDAFDDEASQGTTAAPSHADRELAGRLAAQGQSADPEGFDWLTRTKVDGESVTAIAASEGVPVERVRQRISRMTRRLAAAGAALVALTVLALVWLKYWVRRQATGEIEPDRAGNEPDRSASPPERAAFYRHQADNDCDHGRWNGCLWDLDRARELDPAGDTDPGVRSTRARAEEALGIHHDTSAPVPDRSKSSAPPSDREAKPPLGPGPR